MSTEAASSFVISSSFNFAPNLERSVPAPTKGLDPNEHPQGGHAGD